MQGLLIIRWVATKVGHEVEAMKHADRGDPQALMGVAASPEFGELHARGTLHPEGWHWDIGFAGATIDEIYPGWRELVGA